MGIGIPPVEMAWWAAVALDVVVWAAWGVACGWLAHRLPASRTDHDTALLRARGWERRLYEGALRVPRWQRRLPEAGAILAGGTDKRRLGGSSTASLEAYAAETRRAEIAHWLDACAAPLFAVWNPPGLVVAMVVYAGVANGPCIASLRYNRLRLDRVLAGRARRRAGSR